MIFNMFKHPPKKLKTSKQDLAPFGFYFDFFIDDPFKIPIYPVPMRIDKLTNGQATLFIFPDFLELKKSFERYGLNIDFNLFFLFGIKNLIAYARKMYKEITFQTLRNEIIENWFNSSKLIQAEIPSLIEDFTFITSEFLSTYYEIDQQGINEINMNFKSELIKYCERILEYLKKKLENNKITIIRRNEKLSEKLYNKKKQKFYPNIISVETKNLTNNKSTNLNFVPYLIYDDLIDTFSYNKKLLSNGRQYCDIEIFKRNRIINKVTSTEYFIRDHILNSINLEELL